MKLYVGIDLHSNNSYVAIIDEEGSVIYQKRMANDSTMLIKELTPYKEQITGIVVESTYNWYWIVDALQEAGYILYATYVAINWTQHGTDSFLGQ